MVSIQYIEVYNPHIPESVLFNIGSSDTVYILVTLTCFPYLASRYYVYILLTLTYSQVVRTTYLYVGWLCNFVYQYVLLTITFS